MSDHRVDFTKWWISEFKAVKFPLHGGATVFDFYIDPITKKFEPWSSKVEPFVLDPEQPLQVWVKTIKWVWVKTKHKKVFSKMNLEPCILLNVLIDKS